MKFYSISAALILSVVLLIAGCAVGPDYRRPDINAPKQWSGADGTQLTQEPVALSRWWMTFNDPIMDGLVERAIKANFDLKIAEARVREARASHGIAVRELLPRIDAQADYSRFQNSENGNFGGAAGSGFSTDGDLYQVGFDSRWELDLFGRKRRAMEAARADLEATEELRRDVLVTLLGDVAQSYIDVRGLQARLNIAQENIKAQSSAVDIAKARLQSGVASELDLSQAEALLASTKSQVPLIETLLHAAISRLSLLLGLPPTALQSELNKVVPIPSVPTKIATGLPADLLRRRPDVRAAERELAAATARIGVAKGEYFPKISLLGAFGLQSLDAGELFTSESRFWSIGPSLRWPIFATGRIRAGVRVQNARQEQAAARYEQTVLVALEDAENAMVSFLNEQVRRRHLADAVTAQRRAVTLANKLYINGFSDFLNVIDAERSLYLAEDLWIQSERNTSVTLVSLYKALGGGWDLEATSKN